MHELIKGLKYSDKRVFIQWKKKGLIVSFIHNAWDKIQRNKYCFVYYFVFVVANTIDRI